MPLKPASECVSEVGSNWSGRTNGRANGQAEPLAGKAEGQEATAASLFLDGFFGAAKKRRHSGGLMPLRIKVFHDWPPL